MNRISGTAIVNTMFLTLFEKRAYKAAYMRFYYARNSKKMLLAMASYQKHYRETHRKDICNRAQNRLQLPVNRISKMVSHARRRALKKKLAFDDTIYELLILSNYLLCACCNRELDYTVGYKYVRDLSPTLDRIDNNKGYIPYNVAIVCNRCNTIKSIGGAMIHLGIASYIRTGSPISFELNHTVPLNRLNGAVSAAKRRATLYKLPFDKLACKSLVLALPMRCPCCNNVINYVTGNGHKDVMASPSLDKRLPEKGYVSGNISVICNGCNTVKHTGTAEDHEMIADYIKRHSND